MDASEFSFSKRWTSPRKPFCSPLVLAHVGVIGALGTSRVPGLFSLSCLRGDCCKPFHAALRGPFPRDVRYISLYSRSDGIVDWRACLDPAADEHIEIGGSHLGMAFNIAAYEEIARVLADDPPLAQAA